MTDRQTGIDRMFGFGVFGGLLSIRFRYNWDFYRMFYRMLGW